MTVRRIALLATLAIALGSAAGLALGLPSSESPPSSPPAPTPEAPSPKSSQDGGGAAPSAAQRRLARLKRIEARIAWRDSRALGTTNAGRLVEGVKLPPRGVNFFTWDPVRWTSPNRASRRHGTDRLIRVILDVARRFSRANRDAPRLAVGDISRRGGGIFDSRYGVAREFGSGPGSSGHVSHQNGLDVDIYYPRKDRRQRAPDSLGDIDLKLAQDLVDRFVAAGAQFVFVGPRTGLGGPPGVVQPLDRHDDHLHVRLPQ